MDTMPEFNRGRRWPLQGGLSSASTCPVDVVLGKESGATIKAQSL